MATALYYHKIKWQSILTVFFDILHVFITPAQTVDDRSYLRSVIMSLAVLLDHSFRIVPAISSLLPEKARNYLMISQEY